jgi:adenylate cyclase
VELLGRVFDWIGTNESVLSGIAATIVILGVLYVPIRALLQRARRSAAPSARVEASATPAEAPPRLYTESPSIAVLPFTNLSGDPEHEFLADGLTEDIILGLSRVKQLFVIARNTSFTYKGTTPDAQAVSRDLGVRYVLEGSVRRAGDRVRISAQLVDATTRRPTWAEKFDRKVEEILEVDDEVTDAIVAALQPALRRAEAEQARRASPDDLTAWALVNRAWVTVQSDLGDAEAAASAIEACEQALARDPDYALAHAVLAHARSLLVHQRHARPDGSEDAALASIHRALELGPDDPLVHHCHAAVLGNLGRTDDAIRAWERAIELDPNNAGARAGLGIGMIFQRRASESLELIDGALRRSPADPLRYHWLGNRALALLMVGRTTEAIESARASLQRQPSRLASGVLAIALACEDRLDEAARAWRDFAARFDDLVPENLARLSATVAPDAERAEQVAAAVLRAAAAAERGAT